MTETSKYLLNKYGLTLDTNALAEVCHYETSKSVLNAISRETFPVRTMLMGKRRVADYRDVANYLDSIYQSSRPAA